MGATALTWLLGEASQCRDITLHWGMHPIATSSNLSILVNLTSAHTNHWQLQHQPESVSRDVCKLLCGCFPCLWCQSSSPGRQLVPACRALGLTTAKAPASSRRGPGAPSQLVQSGLCAGLANSLVPTVGDSGPEHGGAGTAEEGAGTGCPGWAQLFHTTRGAGCPSAPPGPGKGVSEEEPVPGGAAG